MLFYVVEQVFVVVCTRFSGCVFQSGVCLGLACLAWEGILILVERGCWL